MCVGPLGGGSGRRSGGRSGFSGGIGSTSAAPQAPAIPEPIAAGSQEETDARTAARQDEERRSRLRQGRRATIATSPLGLTGQATTRRRSLLGA